MLKQKLLSRKFWVVVATFVSAVVAIFAEVEVDPNTFIGVAGVIIAYLGGQSWVDKATVQGQLEVAQNEGLLQAQVYIRGLEAQLAELGAGQPEDITV